MLKSWNICSVGTIRANRLRGRLLKSEKELKTEGRVSVDWSVDASSGIAVVRWLDKWTTLQSRCRQLTLQWSQRQ